MRAVLVAVACAACAPPSSAKKPRDLVLPKALPGSVAGSNVGLLDWHSFFADPDLEAVVGAAVAGNYDVQIAVQRIAIARADVLGTSGLRLPRLALFADASVQKFGRYTMDGAGNKTTEIRPGETVPTHLPDLAFGLEATWEPDLWGRLGNLHGAARARYLASIEGTRLIVTTVVADAASAYVELVALDRTREILDTTIARQTEALELMRVEKQAGRTNELAVQQFAAQLASTRSLSALSAARARAVENELDLLLGSGPAAIARSKTLFERPLPATFAAGVPSELLANRPDIRAAELQVEASKADVAAARAAFYPRLTISAQLGYEAFDPRFLLTTPASVAYRLGASLLAPLVNRRGIEAAFAAAEATQIAAMYEYQRVVLRAFFEVATDLSTLQQAAEIVTQQEAKLGAVTGTVDAADALFRAGKATYLEVLLAQQAKLDAELELVTALRDQRLAMIHLYKALGGGWRGTVLAPSSNG